MKKSLTAVALFVCLSGWYSCTKDKAVAPAPAPVCDSTHVSYTTTMAPIVTQYCAFAGCHDGGTAGANDIRNYIALKAEMDIDSPNVNSILCRIQGTTCGDRMPQSLRPLSAAYIDTFRLWKSGGYCN